MFNIKLQSYIIFITIYVMIDYIWLSFAKNKHLNMVKSVTNQPQLKDLTIDYKAAALFYAFSPLLYFVFVKKLSSTPKEAALYGAIMGLLMYGTFDITNRAIFNNRYEWSYALSDIIWGTFVIGLVCYIMYKLDK